MGRVSNVPLCLGLLRSDLDTRTGEVLRFGDQARQRPHIRVDAQLLSMKKKSKNTRKTVEPGEKSPAPVRFGRWLSAVREQQHGALPNDTAIAKKSPSPVSGLLSRPDSLNVPRPTITVSDATDSKNNAPSSTAWRPISEKPVPRRDITPVRLGLGLVKECVCLTLPLPLDSTCKRCNC